MIRLACADNVIEYTGDGWFQCGDYVNCPKKENQKCLGFDCFAYIDNTPEKLLNIDVNQKNEMQKEIIRNIKEPHDLETKGPAESVVAIEHIKQHVAKHNALENGNILAGGET